tara:strand:+ start:404 stop:655 length:252 start_codon:yes stop_codon:yes gene_type:complete
MADIYAKVETKQIIDCECDVCGKKCKSEYGIERGVLSADWGYGSNKDGERHECHLCEECYDKVKEFIEGLGGKVRTEDCWVGL